MQAQAKTGSCDSIVLYTSRRLDGTSMENSLLWTNMVNGHGVASPIGVAEIETRYDFMRGGRVGLETRWNCQILQVQKKVRGMC